MKFKFTMKKQFLLLFLVSSFTVLAQKDYTLTYDSDKILQDGIALYEEEKYNEAIAQFDRIAKVDPSYITAQYEKAMAMIALEQKVEVAILFDELYRAGKMVDEPNFFVLYGNFLSDAKEYTKADAVFKEGEKHMPNSSSLLYNYAIVKYRMEEKQAALDLLKKTITINPNAASAHYLLGVICFENGKITEGTLAMMSHLIIAPTSSKAQDAILNLNKKFGENFLEKNKLVFSKSGDNFEEIETILRNQLPLKKAYKVQSDIDDVIVRQIQAVVEYTANHKIGDGFFETTYMPWVKDLHQKKQFEGYTYYMLLSMEDNLGKALTSKKKAITDFYKNYIDGPSFWNEFAKRKLDHFGKEEEVVISINNSKPFLIGKVVNGKKEGKYKLLNEYGNISGELNVVNDELEGAQKYFNKKGVLIQEKNFKTSKLNGSDTAYYENGQIKSVDNYKDDKSNGAGSSNHVTGGKQCEGSLVDGERDGKFICYYANGTKMNEIHYSKGKLNGPYILYNSVGDVTANFNYVNGEIDGKVASYYHGKALKSEGVYSKGKIQGTYKKYYINGAIEEEIFYEGGKIKKSIEYYENGKKSLESIYDDNEKLQNYIYYDDKGELYYQENFKGGELRTVQQYSRNNPKPVETNITKKAFTIKDLDGKTFLAGEYFKGERTGEWKYYANSGALTRKRQYKDGKLEGLSHRYVNNGSLESIINYKQDSISGLYEVYNNDKIIQEYFYSKDEKNGPYKIYYPDGKLKEEGIYYGDELYDNRFYYWMNGNIKKKEKYAEDELISVEIYSPSGKKESEFDFRNKTGKFSINYHNGAVVHSFELVNGKYNGKYTVKDKNNTLIYESEFVNGVRHGNYKGYSVIGVVDFENNYYSGYANGLEKSYDEVGNLRLVDEYVFGTEYGKSTRYFVNKSKIFEYNRVNGDVEGEYKYFNSKGDAILILGYEYNRLKYYTTLNAAGELKDRVSVVDETASIVSKYPNGKTAMAINFVKGAKDGNYLINNPEGKTEVQLTYKMNKLEGERKEYYSNGNVYKIERFKNNDFEGIQEYYKEDGKIWLKAEYKNDELHGNTLIYTNGVLSLTKKYDSDELLEITK